MRDEALQGPEIVELRERAGDRRPDQRLGVPERGAQRLERSRRLGGPEGEGGLDADAGVGGGRELPGEEGDPGVLLGQRGPPRRTAPAPPFGASGRGERGGERTRREARSLADVICRDSMARTAAQVREAFLSYFENRGHRRVASSSLVPLDDPSLLFTNAGMVQFKDVFTGREARPTSGHLVQKCVRAGGKHNDLDNVGFTARHHTFFEMLGNFSFGDYFKEDAVAFAWEFVTRDLGFARDRLAATVFNGEKGIPWDEEAARLWKRVGVPESRIHRLGYKDNFWAMGDTGPCGPCSELHYHQGDDLPCAEEAAGRKCLGVACECDRWLEIWNLVFMQFERKEKDSPLEPLPRPSIDTGRRAGAHHRGGRRASAATTTPTCSSRCWRRPASSREGLRP
jgi:hypothetical protein